MKRPQYEIEYRTVCGQFPEYEGGYPIRSALDINVDSVGWIFDIGSHAYVRMKAQAFMDSDKNRNKTWGQDLEELLRGAIDRALDECIRNGSIRKGMPNRVHVVIRDPQLGIT